MKIKCPHCPKSFSRRASLRNHIKIHDTSVGKHLQETGIEKYLREIEEEGNNVNVLEDPEERPKRLSQSTLEEMDEEIMDAEKKTDKETDTRIEMDVDINVERETDVIDVEKEVGLEINIRREMDVDIEIEKEAYEGVDARREMDDETEDESKIDEVEV
jgi:hypothetical protein